ncbi:polyhydroxyalkanoate synthesis repressor PhaR [Lichenicoccus sp.]|uniref:polyhydroxyalkanoate synthesis repressor PhaR n=1 Tax=Lichenicoccus sp. TaxID=2781899 RepID=UPI003D146391
MSEEDRPLPPVVVKKYANRRLYDTESSIYITLDTLADMVRRGRDFVVYDAKTGDDITRAVLTQIIMEEETKGRNMLPTSFLRQLIGFYGDSMQGLVPEYLERMMEQFAAQQAQVRASVERTMQALVPTGSPAALEEVGRQAVQSVAAQNVAVMERATLYSPFYRPGQEGSTVAGPTPARPAGDVAELLALREEVARLREELAQASASLAEMPVRSLARGGARH